MSTRIHNLISDKQQIDPADFYDLLPVATYICDSKGVMTYFNPAAAQLWGTTPVYGNELYGGAHMHYFPDGSPCPKDDHPVARCLATGDAIKDAGLVIEKPDGGTIQTKISVAPIKDQTGHVSGAICCLNQVMPIQKTEWELRKAAYQFEDYAQNGAMSLHWVDNHGIIKWANQAELDMLGYQPDEYIGHHISEFHVHKHKIQDILFRLNDNQTLQGYQSELVCKDGSTKTVQITSNVLRQDGEFVHTRCFTVDVTAQQQLQDALRESEHRFRQLIQGLPAAVYTCDVNGYIDLYNPAAVELWGREPVAGQDLWCGSWKISHPDGSPLPLDECPMALSLKECRQVYGHQIIIERPDGSKRHVLPYPRPILDGSGGLVGAVNMLIDITNVKLAEQALRESEQRFRTVANTAPVLIWMGETIKDRTFFNHCWTDFTGKSEDQLLGQQWMARIHPDDLVYVNQVCGESFDGKKEYKMRYRLQRIDGQYRWMHSHGIPRFSADGSFAGYIGTVVDVHEQKLRKDELKQHVAEKTQELSIANQKLESSNRDLEEFAYVASHDLQEPLRKIQTLGGLLADKYEDKLGETGLDLLKRIRSASARMSILIDDLLSYSRVSSEVVMEPIALLKEIKGVLTDLETPINEKQADVQVAAPDSIYGYPPQIRRLFQNLIGNALKFSRASEPVKISITSKRVKGYESGFNLTADQGELDFVLIEVTDNGIGFDQRYAERIFQVFQKLHGQHQYQGSGIGLAIVHKVVQNHNGYVRAIGKPGQGAIFQILLPALAS